MQQFITSTVPTATYRFLVLGNFDVNYREVLDKLKSMDEKISVGWALPTLQDYLLLIRVLELL